MHLPSALLYAVLSTAFARPAPYSSTRSASPAATCIDWFDEVEGFWKPCPNDGNVVDPMLSDNLGTRDAPALPEQPVDKGSCKCLEWVDRETCVQVDCDGDDQPDVGERSIRWAMSTIVHAGEKNEDALPPSDRVDSRDTRTKRHELFKTHPITETLRTEDDNSKTLDIHERNSPGAVEVQGVNTIMHPFENLAKGAVQNLPAPSDTGDSEKLSTKRQESMARPDISIDDDYLTTYNGKWDSFQANQLEEIQGWILTHGSRPLAGAASDADAGVDERDEQPQDQDNPTPEMQEWARTHDLNSLVASDPSTIAGVDGQNEQPQDQANPNPVMQEWAKEHLTAYLKSGNYGADAGFGEQYGQPQDQDKPIPEMQEWTQEHLAEHLDSSDMGTDGGLGEQHGEPQDQESDE